MNWKLIGAPALVLALAACGGADAPETASVEEPAADEAPAAAAAPAGVGEQATATFINGQGTEIGRATLTQQADGVHIEYDLAFLQGGQKGFHIHTVGTCEAPTFESAGDHFNPTNAQHGLQNPQGPHAGDLENVDIYPDDGTDTGTFVNNRVTLAPGQPNSLLDADGSALVVHQAPDDHTSQPSGGSGDPVACAVIEGSA